MKSKIKWIVDPPHTEIAFKVKYLMISNVTGLFKEFDASIYTTGEDFKTAEIDFWINPASVDTRSVERDNQLKGPDFFDVEKHKQINFTANTLEKLEKGKFQLLGDLSIKGISNRVKLIVEFGGVNKDPWGNEKAGFTLRGKINRKDWGLSWNTVLETGGVLVGDEVKIRCETVLIKSKEKIRQ